MVRGVYSARIYDAGRGCVLRFLCGKEDPAGQHFIFILFSKKRLKRWWGYISRKQTTDRQNPLSNYEKLPLFGHSYMNKVDRSQLAI